VPKYVKKKFFGAGKKCINKRSKYFSTSKKSVLKGVSHEIFRALF
jgi:hypothetical protein